MGNRNRLHNNGGRLLPVWALIDFNEEPIRFFDYPAEGAVLWPLGPKQLEPDDPDWDEPLF